MSDEENEIGKFIIKLRENYVKYKKEYNYGREII